MESLQTIENQFMTVSINDKGAELWELWNRESGEQMIWDGRPEFWNRRTPILFPFVGRSAGNAYVYGGQTYQMGQHGFARDMVFTVVEKGTDFIIHELTANEDTKSRYPFDFALRVTHRLVEKRLQILWEVENRGEETMYFKIGGHPGFLLPEMEDDEPAEYRLYFPGKDSLRYVLIDLATGLAKPEETVLFPLKNGCHPISRHLFDQDALIFDEGQISEVSVLRPDGRPYVTMYCDGFPSMGIWSKPGAPFVCLEPWDGRCDNVGCTGVLEEKPEVHALDGGSIYKKEYAIAI